MEWRIRESSRGGVVADYGINHDGGVEVGFKRGFTMPAFISYYSSHFDTLEDAERYIKNNPNPLN